MYNFIIQIANLNIKITTEYEYTKDLCKDYIVEQADIDFSVSTTRDEIYAEGDSLNNLGYLESLAIYRKIAEKLAQYDAFLMHASVIDVSGCGVAFCAKSGTGKTTHTLLWKQLFDEKLKIVNGDKPIIRFLDGTPYAFGTPYCGKEKLAQNMKTPIKAVGFIKRSERNEVSLASDKEAMKEMLSVCHLPKNSENALKTFDLIGDFLEKVKFYNIYCNMERSAAIVASEKMLKD